MGNVEVALLTIPVPPNSTLTCVVVASVDADCFGAALAARGCNRLRFVAALLLSLSSTPSSTAAVTKYLARGAAIQPSPDEPCLAAFGRPRAPSSSSPAA